MYATGEGVPRNLTEALWWFRKAHAQGLEQAAAAIRKVSQEQRVQQGAAAINPSQLPTKDASPSPIPIGTRVELHSLKAKKLNRQRGVVVGFDVASRRCEVKLDDGRGPYGLKPETLRLLI
jgi:TPR repeat protein